MTAATLTVIGSAGTNPSATRVCASYLLQADGYRLLLDCGNGALHNLQKVIDVAQLDAVLISHLHPDHFADLYGLNYALRFHPDPPPAVPIYGPAGTRDFVGRLLPEESVARMAEHLDFAVAAAGDELRLGPFTVALHAANHPVETLAPRIAVGRRVLAYTGDTGPSETIVECARGADLFVCDATWLERQRPLPAGVHLTGREAGAHAARAGVSRLLLTHISPYNDPDETAQEARRAFAGEVLVATDLQEVPL